MRPTIAEIVTSVGQRYGVSPAVLMSGKRLPIFASRVRLVAMSEVRAAYPALMPRTLAGLFKLTRTAADRLEKWCNHAPLEPQPAPADVIAEFARENRAAVRDIVGKAQFAEIVSLRYRCLRRLVERCPQLSTTDLGNAMGMHHTTVLYALGRITRGAAR